jgi:hypothetical protein
MAPERTPEDASTAANANPQDSIASLAAPPVAAPVEQRSRWKETVKRRGLMVGVAALIAGAMTRRPTPEAEATSGTGPDGIMALGSNYGGFPFSGNTANTAGQLTMLEAAAGFFGSTPPDVRRRWHRKYDRKPERHLRQWGRDGRRCHRPNRGPLE